MVYETHIIHAPSASGKTTFLKSGTATTLTIQRSGSDIVLKDTLYQHGSFGIVDGDTLIHFTIGWPKAGDWWKDRAATYCHAANLFSLVRAATTIDAPSWMKHLVVMFNGGMKQIAAAEKLYADENGLGSAGRLHHHVMIPSREIHERNIESRIKEAKEAGKEFVFPANWGDASNNRKSAEQLAVHFDVDVHDSFESILSSIDGAYSQAPESTEPEDSRDEPKKAPSIRKFDIEGLDVASSLEQMERIAIAWTNDQDDLGFYFDKIKEEYDEFVEGEDEDPTFEDGVMLTTGDTRLSESFTVVLTVLHWMRHRTGLDYSTLMAMANQRYREQADRYSVDYSAAPPKEE